MRHSTQQVRSLYKDVPLFAIVGGVFTKIIKYRVLPEQIELLMKKWWAIEVD